MLLVITFVSFLVYITNADQQALSTQQISNGRKTSIKYFPSIASLIYNGKHICGASIIDQRTLITAAHCLVADSNPIKYQIRVGSTTSNTGGQVIGIKDIVVHNLYNIFKDSGKYVYDVGLIFPNEMLRFDRKIQPIQLPSIKDEIPYGKEVVVVGWGATRLGGQFSNDLRYIKVPLLNQDECIQVYGSYKISAVVICAGAAKNGKDACRGDSGGPLIYNGKLFGIVAWGEKCIELNKPGVYTNVKELLEWIDSSRKFAYLTLWSKKS